MHTIGQLITLVELHGGTLTPTEGDTLHYAGPPLPTNIAALVRANRDALLAACRFAQRMTTGWEACEAASATPQCASLENHWLSLLERYQEVCDQACVGTRVGISKGEHMSYLSTERSGPHRRNADLTSEGRAS